MSSIALSLKGIQKTFGETPVIKPMNLDVKSGEFLVLVGPSGCGKSTLLRLIAGLEKPDAGDIFIHEEKVTKLEPRDRNLAMVFQNYALYPHLKVRDNLEFGVRVRKLAKSEIDRRINFTSEMLGLTDLLERYPRELSGGQRQRVALGRALVRECPLILFDEPLSNLDAHLRTQMRAEIKSLHNRLGNTMIYVTHDQIEATTMGDRIAVLNKGEISQISSPQEIYSNPKNSFVATFIGSPEINFFPPGLFTQASDAGNTAALRPEHFSLNQGAFEGRVLLSENLGASALVHFEYKGQTLRALTSSSVYFSIGQKLLFQPALDKLLFFDQKTGARK
jgi:ABC-type sugar transport system ATPase subunit